MSDHIYGLERNFILKIHQFEVLTIEEDVVVPVVSDLSSSKTSELSLYSLDPSSNACQLLENSVTAQSYPLMNFLCIAISKLGNEGRGMRTVRHLVTCQLSTELTTFYLAASLSCSTPNTSVSCAGKDQRSLLARAHQHALKNEILETLCLLSRNS